MVKTIQYFNVQGTLVINKEKIQFSKAIRATSEEEAKAKILLHYGSKHNVQRQLIKITSVKGVKREQVDDVIGQEFSSEGFKYIRG